MQKQNTDRGEDSRLESLIQNCADWLRSEQIRSLDDGDTITFRVDALRTSPETVQVVVRRSSNGTTHQVMREQCTAAEWLSVLESLAEVLKRMSLDSTPTPDEPSQYDKYPIVTGKSRKRYRADKPFTEESARTESADWSQFHNPPTTEAELLNQQLREAHARMETAEQYEPPLEQSEDHLGSSGGDVGEQFD